jgi:hypothetical protein
MSYIFMFRGGVGVITGRDDLSLLAWSDVGPSPDVHVYQYLLPSQTINLKGDAVLEYVSQTLN